MVADGLWSRYMNAAVESKIGGRCVALFPGAFRPPHVNHFDSVRALIERDDIDEIVVVVTNRVRDVGDTGKVLPPSLAYDVWDSYLDNHPKVTVEVAPGSAVARTLELVRQAKPGDTILLCVGFKDYGNGMGRFSKLDSLAVRRGVVVEIECTTADVVAVSATDMRDALAEGESGRARFETGLPGHLCLAQNEYIWNLCLEAMVDRKAHATARVREIVEGGVGPVRSVELFSANSAISANSADGVFRVALADDSDALFVKYGEDTVSAAGGAADAERKPRKRAKVEREALKFVTPLAAPDVVVPRVALFDSKLRTIALGEVCRGAPSLKTAIEAKVGEHDANIDAVVEAAARFLSRCHLADAPPEPFWDKEDADSAQWRLMLSRHTIGLTADIGWNTGLRELLKALYVDSDRARVNTFVHLDLVCSNVLVGADEVGIIDFERSSTVGDPALDAGLLAGDLLSSGLAHGHNFDSFESVSQRYYDRFIEAYSSSIGAGWNDMSSRVTRFAGARLLSRAIAAQCEPECGIYREIAPLLGAANR